MKNIGSFLAIITVVIASPFAWGQNVSCPSTDSVICESAGSGESCWCVPKSTDTPVAIAYKQVSEPLFMELEFKYALIQNGYRTEQANRLWQSLQENMRDHSGEVILNSTNYREYFTPGDYQYVEPQVFCMMLEAREQYGCRSFDWDSWNRK